MASAFEMEVSSAMLERAATFAGHSFAAASEDETAPPDHSRRPWAAIAAGLIAIILVAIALI